MKKEMISVIVPVYNVEKYLHKCVDSIITQKYKSIEIILVNDGSTDNSGKICDEYVAKDCRIRVIHKKNGGLSDARNYGIEQAKGSYYCFIDSDDYITNNTLETMYESMVNHDCDIAVCNMLRFFEDGSTLPFYQPCDQEKILNGEQRFETLKQPSVCNKLFRAHLFDGVRFPKGKYYEDTYIYHILAHRANRIVLTGHDGYWYLSRKESILGQPIYTDRYFDFIEAVWIRTKYLLDNNINTYGIEACLSLYIAYGNAEKCIKKNDNNRKLFELAREKYWFAYEKLMKQPDIGIKQKIKLLTLRLCPSLHSVIF